MHRACRAHGIDVADVADFTADTHEVLKDRPVYYPGAMGGHCLIPNTLLLRDFHPSFRFLGGILDSNAQRERELEDESVREDVERIRRV